MIDLRLPQIWYSLACSNLTTIREFGPPGKLGKAKPINCCNSLCCSLVGWCIKGAAACLVIKAQNVCWDGRPQVTMQR